MIDEKWEKAVKIIKSWAPKKHKSTKTKHKEQAEKILDEIFKDEVKKYE